MVSDSDHPPGVLIKISNGSFRASMKPALLANGMISGLDE
jgi:hypothetical protein